MNRPLLRMFLVTCAVLVATAAPRVALSQPFTFIGSFPTDGIPCGLALGANGTLYVADEYNNIGLRLFSQSGVPMGTFNPGSAIESYGIGFLSDQSVVFTDYYGKRVLRYKPDGTLLGQFATGGVNSAWLAVDGSDNIYVTDSEGDLVRKFTSTGALITGFFVNHPAGVAFAEGKVFVTEQFGGNIRVFAPDGTPLGSFSNAGATFAQQLHANGAGLLYLGDHGTDMLRCFTTAGTLQWTLGPAVAGYPFANAELFSVDQAPDGTLFVGDFNNHNVLIFTPSPTPTARTTFGALKARYRGDVGRTGTNP
jgi:DNA-binding beta-propeller fold protein YncE